MTFQKLNQLNNKNNKPINQHFIPKCYLNGFINLQKTFLQLTRGKEKFSLKTPSQVCYLENFYNVKTEYLKMLHEIDDETYIEKQSFKYQENNYSKYLSLIVQFTSHPKIIVNEFVKLIIETLITIKRRNPSFKKALIERMINASKGKAGLDFIQNLHIDYGFSITQVNSESFMVFAKNYWENFQSNPDRLHDLYLSEFVDKKSIESIVSHLIKFKLYVLHAPIGSEFITSDNPGFVISNDQIFQYGGFGDSFEFYFPITSQCCIYINNKNINYGMSGTKEIHPFLIDKNAVRKINVWTALISVKKVFAKNSRELEIIKNNRYN